MELKALRIPETNSGIERLADNISRLENQLEEERDRRNEERFVWVCAVCFLVDGLIVPSVGAMFLPIFLFQLVVLVFLAEHMGVDRAVQLLGPLLDRISRKGDDS